MKMQRAGERPRELLLGGTARVSKNGLICNTVRARDDFRQSPPCLCPIFPRSAGCLIPLRRPAFLLARRF